MLDKSPRMTGLLDKVVVWSPPWFELYQVLLLDISDTHDFCTATQ